MTTHKPVGKSYSKDEFIRSVIHNGYAFVSPDVLEDTDIMQIDYGNVKAYRSGLFIWSNPDDVTDQVACLED